MKTIPYFFFLAIFLIGCSTAYQYDKNYGPARTVDRNVAASGPGKVSFYEEVQPIIERRCNVCHSCYDAPCQLKTTSVEGIERGATKLLVYNGARILRAKATRLYIDGNTVQEWRELKFHPVLNERDQTVEANKETSVMYKMLELKRDNPQPTTELLPPAFDLTLDKENICTSAEDFADFKEKYPMWGMPYALPGMTAKEHDIVSKWIEQGSKITPRPASSPESMETVNKWEVFFNGASLKERLMTRYIYEHLFIGHIHFNNLGDREFYRLVRSVTPPGLPIDEIATDRPYDDPGVANFYYRLRPVLDTIAVKNHTVYRVDETTMPRYRELFLGNDYTVTALPGYGPKTGSNPFVVFKEIPAKSRYKFLLDNAEFTIRCFIKGPVCRGQIALNVVNDHFFVAFTDPEKDFISNDTTFLANQSTNLALPAEAESTIRVLSLWHRLFGDQTKYLKAKEAYYEKEFPDNIGPDISYIWDGNGTNNNALLTVFRHFDSATVVRGQVGATPKTGWILDYPLLERVHYLLVAGFNVFGNVGHQLSTRLYMDLLRWEGENAFLAYLPKNQREIIRNQWYRGSKAELKNAQDNHFYGLQRETGIHFAMEDPKTEFFEMLRYHVDRPLESYVALQSCPNGLCSGVKTDSDEHKADAALSNLAKLRGNKTQAIPDVTFLRVITGDRETDLAYTVIRNKALSNNSFLFDEARRRIVDEDYLTVVKGHLGSYPNAFCRVRVEDLDAFAEEFLKAKDKLGYYNFARKYAVRRTSTDFWFESDWHYQQALKESPVEGGLFDMFRYHRIAEVPEADYDW